jgi:transcriptional regulator with XRE-family HTH domain
MMKHPIEQWLQATGKTKSELARTAGVSRMAIWRIINGDKALTLAMLSKVSDVTDIPASKLIVHREAAQP